MKSIAEDLKTTEEKATEIYNAVLTNIHGLKHFMDESQEMARQLGFVETKCGRRRHIPDMQLPPFEITSVGTKNFDPFFDSEQLGVIDDIERLKRKYLQEISQAKYKQQKEKIKLNAEKDGFKIKENTKKIEDATRQCVNCVDENTEILTKRGWKKYVDLKLNEDEIMTLNTSSQKLEWELLTQLNIFEGQHDVMKIIHPTFSAITTENHRWPVYHKKHKQIEWKQSKDFYKNGKNWCDYSLLRCADNDFEDADYPDWFLKIIGYYLTDGEKGTSNRSIKIYQNQKVNKNKCDIIDSVLNESNIPYTKCILKNNAYCAWNIGFETGEKIRQLFPEKILTLDFVNSLSQRQAKILIDAMLLEDSYIQKYKTTFITNNLENANIFQILCVIAGVASNIATIDKYVGRKYFSENTINKDGCVTIRKPYYIVRLLRRQTINIYKKHIEKGTCNLVWCPTTKNGTWVARRNTEIYITGNSRVQGSAADQSKTAMRIIDNNQKLKDLDFHMMILVHDEILGECPLVNAKEVEPLFVQCMLDSAKAIGLRTGAACDASTILRWYGKELDLNNLDVEQLIKDVYSGKETGM